MWRDCDGAGGCSARRPADKGGVIVSTVNREQGTATVAHNSWTFVRILASIVAAISMSSLAHAVFVLNSDDADDEWPGYGGAPVRTSILEGGSRGVRGDRWHYQTFEAPTSFSVDDLMFGYVWAGGTTGGPTATNFNKVRILAVTRTFDGNNKETGFTIVNQVTPTFSFAVDGTGKVAGATNYYAVSLGWDTVNHGQLILPPRTGTEAYAFELNGTYVGQGSSAISLLERQINPNGSYDRGRAYEYLLGPAGSGTGVEGSHTTDGTWDFPLIVKAFSGDFNMDGIVDNADYVLWRKANGGPLSNNPYEGVVHNDQDVFNTWRLRYGLKIPGVVPGAGAGVGVSSVVPEPASASLLGAILLWGAGCRRARRAG